MKIHCTNCNSYGHISKWCPYKKRAKDYSELPRAKMRRLKVAFDVDGTLIENGATATTDMTPNPRIIRLLWILSKFKNTQVYVWSGRGEEWAQSAVEACGITHIVKPSRCLSKFNAPAMDLAIDDIQDTDLAKLNLIVREK